VAKKKKAETEDPGVKPEAVHIPGGESLADRIIPHLKKIFVSVIVITVILVGFFSYRCVKYKGLESDTASLSSAMEVLNRDVVPPPEAGSGSGSGSGSDAVVPTPVPDPKKPQTFASYRERAETGLKKLSGPVGSVFRGNLLLEAGKLDQAEAAYKQVANRKDLEGVLAREGLGFVAEARAHAATDAGEREKLLQAALATFQQITTADDQLHAEYRHYHAGRILVLLDKRAEATTALEKAREIAPESELAPLIEMRLAQLEAMQ
jgi:tetratricopeptide (TPR) repeat protein